VAGTAKIDQKGKSANQENIVPDSMGTKTASSGISGILREALSPGRQALHYGYAGPGQKILEIPLCLLLAKNGYFVIDYYYIFNQCNGWIGSWS
jgi:hypothetical protein